MKGGLVVFAGRRETQRKKEKEMSHRGKKIINNILMKW